MTKGQIQYVKRNKGGLRNDLARAVCLNRLGEIRDRTFEAQRHRASGLNLVTAAIILWNTVYIDRAIGALRNQRRRSMAPGSSTSRRSTGTTST